MRLIHRASLALSILVSLTIFAAAQSGKFTVQIVAAPSQAEADTAVKELKAKGIEAYVVKSQVPGKGTFFRVRAGIFSNASDARKYGETLKQQGIVTDFFIAGYERPTTVSPATQPEATESAAASKPTAKPAGKAAEKAALVEPKTNEPEKTASPVKESSKPAPAGKEPSKSASTGKEPSKETTTNDPKSSGGKETATTGGSSAVLTAPTVNFTQFKDTQVGFTFDYPAYWAVNPLTSNAAQAQRVNAGAYFESVDDNAFMNVIWNELDKANNPANNNDLIIDVILTSMKSGKETQSMDVISRKVEEAKGQIKTYLELRAKFVLAGQASPLEFLGKALIVRANKGILLVAMFYSKDAPAQVPGLAERVIASVKTPE